ncbi:MAG: class A beta-lactamase, subclass A2 [Chitinophagaceae bacterium]|nr:class A beta-lactamase, subclass A2 [Chitinophagaceae bacterium]
MRKLYYIVVYLLLTSSSMYAQNIDTLKSEIVKIISTKKATVGVSIIGSDAKDTLNINGYRHFPMISVFKFHIALTVLNKVDKGELSLGQKVFIKKSDLLENTWSPFKKKYSNRDTSIKLREALQWMVSHSDNNICDILIRLIGGVQTVDNFIQNKNFVIKNDEEGMHLNWDAQYLNTTTPNYTTQLLKKLYDKKMLTKKSTKFLYETMLATSVGQNRLKAKLPESTKVAHRTGSSFTNDIGLTGAINDIGIVKMPNGKCYFISVFVYNTSERFEVGEAIIADISKVTWDYFTRN